MYNHPVRTDIRGVNVKNINDMVSIRESMACIAGVKALPFYIINHLEGFYETYGKMECQ